MDSPENSSAEPAKPSAEGSSSYAEHMTKLIQELQTMADQTNAKNETESTPAQTDRLGVFDGVTTPESRRYEPGEQYRFLVHGVIDDAATRSTELAADQPGGFDRTDVGRPLNCSLIDSNHTTTFEGKNGFIIKPPTDGEAVVAAYGSDAGVNDSTAENSVPSAEQLLASTDPETYNQVNITRGQIEGVYIRVRPDGSELGNPGQNAQLRQLAEAHGWPVAEIVASPLDLKAGQPDLTTESIGDGLTKWSVNLPEDGSIVKFDIVRYDDLDRAREANEKAYFSFDEHGIDIRLRQIDSYGQTGGGDIVDEATLAHMKERVRQEIFPQVDEQTRQTLELGLQRLEKAAAQPEAQDKESEKATPEQAFEQHYAEYTSPEYIEPNNERAKAAKGQATVYEHDGHIVYTFAQIKVDKDGKAIDGHDRNPEAQSFADQEQNFAKFMEMTAAHPETRVVVVEGTLRGPFESRDEAIEKASDSGLSQHLAAENGIEIVTAESADNAQLIEQMVEAGVDRSVAENYFVIRDAQAYLDGLSQIDYGPDDEKPDITQYLGSILYASLARQGREGFHDYSPEEKQEIEESGGTEEILKLQNAKVAPLINELNEIIGQEVFIVKPDGMIDIRPDLIVEIENKDGTKSLDISRAYDMLDPAGQGRGSELSRLNIKLRDRHIWETVTRLESEGKDVFMDYGGSHIMTLRPVMEAYFGPPIDKNY